MSRSSRIGVALLLMSLAPAASAYSSGSGTCIANFGSVSGMPGTTLNAGPGTFSINTSSSVYLSGQTISVSFSGGNFTGLLIYALDGAAQKAGTFESLPATVRLMPECMPTASTVTHANAATKNSVSLVWRAPVADVGSLQFVALGYDSSMRFYMVSSATLMPDTVFASSFE